MSWEDRRAIAGVTGRKIIVDTYGGAGSHGGGAFSGKDPSKVDRSASYMARYVAKNLVAAGLADRMEVQLAYSIGVAQPVSVNVDTAGTAKISPDRIAQIIVELFDMRPRKIIEKLDLLRPIYRKTACCGHFGRLTTLISPGRGSTWWTRSESGQESRKREVRWIIDVKDIKAADAGRDKDGMG